MERGNYLNTSRCKKISTYVKGERTFKEITYKPSSVKPGDTFYVNLPRVKDLVIVPGSFALTFDMDIVLDPAEPGSTVNTFPVNNLAANIISKYVIKIGSTVVYELNNAHIYNTYADLWLPEKQRLNSVFKGIQEEELRKLRTDLRATISNPSAVNVALRKIFGKRYCIPLKFEIIDDHMPLPTDDIVHDITFELTVNSKEYVLKYTKDTADFELKDLKLQYETIRDADLKREIEGMLEAGTVFLYDHVHHFGVEDISKKATSLNVDIDGIDRRSLKGVLLLFQSEFTAGQRDSEHFPDPHIKKVMFTIDGAPTKVYNPSFQYLQQWNEIFKHFVPEDFKRSHDIHMDMHQYYGTNRYAFWIDLRSTEDNNIHGSGKKQESKKTIRMEVTKENQGDGEYKMHIFLVSDARVLFQKKEFITFEI